MSTMAAATAASCACPLGKLDPGACVRGSRNIGRERSTAVLTDVFSNSLPIAVTMMKAAERRRPCHSSTTTSAANNGT